MPERRIVMPIVVYMLARLCRWRRYQVLLWHFLNHAWEPEPFWNIQSRALGFRCVGKELLEAIESGCEVNKRQRV
jgi:hypothetical protein